jgi:hypothetical protein
MSPLELVDAIEDADACEPSGRRRIILELTAPTVLGQKGKPLGVDPVTGRRIFGYRRTQCRRILATIYEAAREDAGLDDVD